MTKKIFGTIISRFLSAIITLLIVILASNSFGPAGMGDISLIILSITIILMVSNFVGGGALVYLIPRHNVTSIFILSYIWAVFACVATSFIMQFFHLLPENYFIEILLLSLLFAFTSINTTIFIAKEKINLANIITILQVILQIVSLYFLLQNLGTGSIKPYIIALYISWGISFVISIILVFSLLDFKNTEPIKPLIKESFKFGSYVQFANIIQLLNYRLSYYLLNAFSGKSILGNYSIGVQLSEGLWIVSKSLATVQYAKIANQNNKQKSVELSLQFLKISFLVTFFGLFVLLLIPGNTYILLFGEGFLSVKKTILLLSPGILSVACYSNFSHFFSGIGKHYFNTIGSLTGFLFTVIGGFILIPLYDLTGAAVTASVSYFFTFLFQLIVFIRISKTKFLHFIPSKKDFTSLLYLLKK